MTQPPAGRLETLVAQCIASGIGRQALLLRLDRLPQSLSRPHHHRLAEAALSPLLRASRAALFPLPGPRLAVTWRGDADTLVLEVVEELQHLLADEAAPSLAELVTLYDLPADGPLLLDAVRIDAPAAPPPAETAPPMDLPGLILLESMLAQADVSRFARRRPVWRITQAVCSLAWETRTLSLPELSDALLPGRDLAGAPWLFRRLSRTLDRRLLALLSCPGELADAPAFALSLNIASVLDPEFLRFDAALPPALRGQVTLGLAPSDIVADAAAFGFARGFARARRYRLMLQDASPAVLSLLSADALEVDCLMLPWTADLPAHAAHVLDRDASGLVLDCGDDSAALAWGRAAGLTLFTGAAADALAARA